MKGNKGITLIALVITIIVLLILAAVSIAMLTGENSILKRASQSSAENRIGAANDAVSLFVTDKIAEFYEEAYANGNNTIVTKANTNTDIAKDTTNTNNTNNSNVQSNTGDKLPEKVVNIIFIVILLNIIQICISKLLKKNNEE